MTLFADRRRPGLTRPLWFASLFVAISNPIWGQQSPQLPAAELLQTAEPTQPESATLSFSFERVPWRDVIKWLAEECGLALQYEELPTGSFSYDDPNLYSQQAAIERVNLFLLPQGFTLVRSGKLLCVINLGDPRSKQQLSAIADLVTPTQLGDRGDHDVVKCIFPLGDFASQDAIEELAPLNLMTTPFVFNKTKQIMVTDTVAKLKSVKAILDSFQVKGLKNGTVIKSFALKHVQAEDIFVVARPHLGLATDELIGIDVSLSSDVQGQNIFVTGLEDRVKLIENLIQSLDVPPKDASATTGDAVLKSHFVEGGNLQTVYSVLQTMLAGKSVRLSVDDRARSIVALATTDIQSEIAKTVAELQASEAEFEVIPLKSIDPHYAIGLLEEMLDRSQSPKKSSDLADEPALIDADPGNKRLFVRGKRYQIEEIKKIITELESSGGDTPDQTKNTRILSLRADQIEQVLQTVVRFWQKANPIVLLPPSEQIEFRAIERVVGVDPTRSKLVAADAGVNDSTAGRLLTKPTASQAPLIRCQITSRGLLLQSEDTAALDHFEQELRIIAGTLESTPAPPVVFYLQYMKPADALRMLAELLDGAEAAKEGEAGTLVNGYISSPGSFLGNIVTSRDGTATMISGSTTVVADSRLNRLIAQGTSQDIKKIEDYLKIVDKDRSIADIKTYGTARLIELTNTKASEVAAAIREAYAGRVSAGSASSAPTPSGTQQARESVANKGSDNEKGGDEKQQPPKATSNQPVQNLEPKMTIAIHEPSNSLIVTAPEQLFAEVEQLAKSIDSRSQQTVEIVPATNVSMLKSLFGGGTTSGNSGGGSSGGSSRGNSSNDSARNAVLEMLKSRGR